MESTDNVSAVIGTHSGIARNSLFAPQSAVPADSSANELKNNRTFRQRRYFGHTVYSNRRDELIRQAAQGEVVHNDDTSMRVLRLAREPSDERTGVFTSGIVSTGQGWKVALYFTGRQHAGENIADVLQQRAKHASSPIQMCDALSRNVPKLAARWRFCWRTASPMGEDSSWK